MSNQLTLIINLTNTADKGVVLLFINQRQNTHGFFHDSRQRVCGSMKIYSEIFMVVFSHEKEADSVKK